MLRRIALLLWCVTSLGCPAERASEAAVVRPQPAPAPIVAPAPAPTPAVEGEKIAVDEACCGAEGPSEVALPPEGERAPTPPVN